jgi:hypothetical protein
MAKHGYISLRMIANINITKLRGKKKTFMLALYQVYIYITYNLIYLKCALQIDDALVWM